MRRGERGAAMLVALGGLALIAALAAAALSQTAAPLIRAGAAIEQARATRIAEGAIHRLAAAMAGETDRRAAPLDGAVLATTFEGARIDVSAQDVAGLVDLNAAESAALVRLLTAVGAGAAAEDIAEIWVEARRDSRRGAYIDAEEAIAALPEDLRAAARPALAHATTYSGRLTIDPFVATAPALAAIADLPLDEAQAFVADRALNGPGELPAGADLSALDISEGRTIRLIIRVTTEGGGRARIEAVIRSSDSRRAPIRILAWR